MATTGYQVTVDELTVHKAVRAIQHPITGESLGYQNGNGEIFYRDEVISREDMNPDWADALDSGDDSNSLFVALSKKLKPVSDEPTLNEAYRLGLPFEGYDDMDEEDILAAMRVLPSAAVTRIKEWEKSHDNRERIALFNIGYQESPADRQEGLVSSAHPNDDDYDPTKQVRDLVTREVPEDGTVRQGEGITGIGVAAIPPGEHPDRDEDGDTPDEDTGPEASVSKGTGTARQRRSRRARAAKKTTEGDGDSGGDDNS